MSKQTSTGTVGDSPQVSPDELAMRSFDRSLPMALLAARESAMKLFRPMLAEHDLTEQQWRVLRALHASDEPIEVGPLGELASLLAPSVSRILANLETRDLIVRTVAAHDQRRAAISLSSAGTTLVDSIAPESESTYIEIERRFGQARLQRLLHELRDLTASLNNPQANS